MSDVTTSGAPGEPEPMDHFVVSPFARLARAHLLSVAGDALFAIALAGSVFFDVSVDRARWQVTLYLLFTIAPFAAARSVNTADIAAQHSGAKIPEAIRQSRQQAVAEFRDSAA